MNELSPPLSLPLWVVHAPAHATIYHKLLSRDETRPAAICQEGTQLRYILWQPHAPRPVPLVVSGFDTT